jgi:hypothetical protein
VHDTAATISSDAPAAHLTMRSMPITIAAAVVDSSACRSVR